MKLSNDQKALVQNILKKPYDKFKNKLYTYSCDIKILKDGNMGSFKFAYDNENYKNKTYPIGEIQFNDIDGVLCIATLYAYEDGRLDSLDIWKVDFSPLIKYPNIIQI